jgi:F-type H+-transporting ATPase subunit b
MLRRHGKRHNLLLLFSLLGIALFLFCGVVFSAGENVGGHEGADRSGDLKDLFYRFMNFALLAIILFWALKKVGIKGFFTTRSEEIRQRLEDLKKGKEEAEKKYQEIERELKAFGEERQNIIEQFRKEGLAEKEKILAEARKRVEQIIQQGERSIQQEMQAAKDRLKTEVFSLAAEKAQEIISNEITERDQENLVDEFIERVGKRH